MKIEKIDKSRIRGRWQSSEVDKENDKIILSGGDDTVISIEMCADKINELVEQGNRLEEAIRYVTSIVPMNSDFRNELTHYLELILNPTEGEEI